MALQAVGNPIYVLVEADPPHLNGNGNTLHHHVVVPDEIVSESTLRFRKCTVVLMGIATLLFTLGIVLNATDHNEVSNLCFITCAITFFTAGFFFPTFVNF